MPTSNTPAPPPQGKNLLEQVLSLFSVVKSGEGGSAILLTLNVFLLLAAYYFLKIVRDTLILDESGAAAASYSAAGQALLLLLVVPAYGYLAAKVNRIRLVSGATLFFVSHLVLFFLLGSAGYRIGIPFYLWLGIFSVFVVAQFWAFANDIYSEEQGKRLFPIIAVGASLGAWVGSSVIERTFERLGAYFTHGDRGRFAGRLCLDHPLDQPSRKLRVAGAAEAQKAQQPLGKEGGFGLVLSSRYLMAIAILILLLNVVNSTGGYLLNSLVESASDAQVAAGTITIGAQRQAFIGEYLAGVYAWVNLLGLLIQMFLVSRIFRFIGIRGALFVLPCIAIGGYGLLIALPMLQIVRIVKIAENSTDYSLMNTIRAALYLPTSREVKYKAKQAIDTFFVRLGDMLQAGVVFVGIQLGFGIRNFAVANTIFCLMRLGVAVVIFREHKRITKES